MKIKGYHYLILNLFPVFIPPVKFRAPIEGSQNILRIVIPEINLCPFQSKLKAEPAPHFSYHTIPPFSKIKPFKMKEIKVKAATGRKKTDELFTDEGIISYYVPVYDERKVSNEFFQQYVGTVQLKSTLTVCSVSLIEYMAENMKRTNTIRFNAQAKKEFISSIRKINPKKSYSIGTIENAIRELNRKKFIWKIETKTYMVNPLYFFKSNSRKTRIELIQQLIKEGKI